MAKDYEIYALQCLRVFEMRLAGMKAKEIALQLKVTPATVWNMIAYAKREGLTKEYEGRIIANLVPKAIEVYRQKLEEGDAFVAKDVIDKLVKLGDRFNLNEQNAESREGKSLEHYLLGQRAKNLPQPLKGSTIDIQPVRPKQLNSASFDESDPRTDSLDDLSVEGLEERIAQEYQPESTKPLGIGVVAIPAEGSGEGDGEDGTAEND